MTKYPNETIAINQQGLKFIKNNSNKKALNIFREGIKKYPNDFRLNYNLAHLLYDLGKNKEALKFIKKTRQHMKNVQPYGDWLSNVYQLKEAIKRKL